MDNTTKTGINAAKAASKRVVQQQKLHEIWLEIKYLIK